MIFKFHRHVEQNIEKPQAEWKATKNTSQSVKSNPMKYVYTILRLA
jgi:hypothetical protein